MQPLTVYCPGITEFLHTKKIKKTAKQAYMNPYSLTSVAAVTEYSWSESKPITPTLFTVSYATHSAAYSYLGARD
jgi:precorrin-4 methylase